jgi:sensor histidine kinase YesM
MQQRLLRTQMNPHFIFNALSAIQVYILENDTKKSSSFLSNFATLMRQVLRSSQYEYVTIAEEIKMLGYYLELQQLRFIEPFSFQIETDPKLDENYVLIPPMITQPFIENAIEHGIRSRGENGQVHVRFINHNDRLGIEIEDNGIGWKPSKENGDMDKKHESMAIKITHERLEVIKKVTKKKTHLEIIDLQEKMPDKTGVLVRMEIPIINLAHKIKKTKNRQN